MSRLHEWSWSGLPLVTHNQPKSGFWFQTFAGGFDLGAPEGVRVVRESLLLDGDDSTIERWGNRQITFRVAVYGYSNADLNDGERELAYRMGSPTVLSWVPPESGAETWFSVRTASFRLVSGDDLDLEWVRPGVRYQVYEVAADCAPFAMSPDLIEESFAPGAATVTVADDCTAATNWPGMTTTTHLSLSAVQTSVLTAQNGLVSTTIRYAGTLPAANFMYIDLAFTKSGYSGSLVPPRLQPSGRRPLASQVLANGYTRYFWNRVASPEIVIGLNSMSPGDTARFFVDQIGTSNLLPSGQMYGVSTIGSVRMPARLRIGHPQNGSGVGETLLYADPSMMGDGWNPGNGLTYLFAPEGSYWVYVRPQVAYVSGDVFSLTIGGKTKTTRTEWAGAAGTGQWFPIGPFHLGGNLSRRIGAGVEGLPATATPTVSLSLNGGIASSGHGARLFRASKDASLLHVRAVTTFENQYVFVDPASFDTPRPGVFGAGDPEAASGAASLLTVTDSWAWPVILPPFTVFWMQCVNTTTPTLRVRHRPLFHTFAAKAV